MNLSSNLYCSAATSGLVSQSMRGSVCDHEFMLMRIWVNLNGILLLCSAEHHKYNGLFLRALRPACTGLRPARFTRVLPELEKKLI